MPLCEYSFDGIVASVRAHYSVGLRYYCPIGRYWARWEDPVPAAFRSSFGAINKLGSHQWPSNGYPET